MLLQINDHFRDIRGLIADAFHIGDHFQRGGNLTEILRHRLLLQQKAKTACFNVAFHLIDLPIQRGNFRRQILVAFHQSAGGHGDRFFAEGSHFQQFLIQCR